MNYFIFFFLLISHSSFAQNISIKNFGSAKSILKEIYGKKNFTFYCLCPYQKNSIDTKKCKISTNKYKKRQKRLEWEHIVPAHAFGQSFKEWRESKTLCSNPNKKKLQKFLSPRKCAAQKNTSYSYMESDIYNIVPANGAINALRSNFSMAELDNKNTEICLGVYIGHRKFMPNIKQKGNVARIYMYMDQTYPGRGIISDKNKKLFEAWDKIDPVDKEECELTRLKEKYQKNKNMIILDRCTKLSL